LMTAYLTAKDVQTRYVSSSWQRVLYSEFEATLLSNSRPFPCVFGVTGLKSDQVRVAFPDPLDAATLAPILQDYVSHARDFGRMTSLIVFARPGPVQDIEHYRKRFWSLLDDLEHLDPSPRPTKIPRDLDTPGWEFCFAGEPIFVVCNTPAHVMRQSRRSTSFMITFQPRWVFDGITNSDDPAVLRSLRLVRERLESFDAIPNYPYLGHYGDPDNREYQQYFIDDTNEAPACPYHQLSRPAPNPKGEVA
jgi:FPC/CPF motif-containing protein YcgG